MKKNRLSIVFVAVALVAVMLAGCSVITGTAETTNTGPASTTITTSLYDEDAIVALYERCIPAVVQINVKANVNEELTQPFNFNVPQQKGQGSGFIIDDLGHILTNNHVVDSATDVSVVLYDGEVLKAEIVGTDRENDLALVKVDPDKLSTIEPLEMGDSDEVKPGQMAIALGSPFGLQGSITAGIISGVGRSLTGSSQRAITNMLQTDAAINPGNSGGPLLNSSGEVVGINTAIETASSGIGFAIPINTAESLLPDLLKGGEVKTAWLGTRVATINEELVGKLNLPVSSGIYVVDVTLDSPSAKAGLKGGGLDEQGEFATGGDIITAIDGKNISQVEDLITYLNGKKPGDVVSLSVQRGNQALTIQATVEEWPDTLS